MAAIDEMKVALTKLLFISKWAIINSSIITNIRGGRYDQILISQYDKFYFRLTIHHNIVIMSYLISFLLLKIRKMKQITNKKDKNDTTKI